LPGYQEAGYNLIQLKTRPRDDKGLCLGFHFVATFDRKVSYQPKCRCHRGTVYLIISDLSHAMPGILG